MRKAPAPSTIRSGGLLAGRCETRAVPHATARDRRERSARSCVDGLPRAAALVLPGVRAPATPPPIHWPLISLPPHHKQDDRVASAVMMPAVSPTAVKAPMTTAL